MHQDLSIIDLPGYILDADTQTVYNIDGKKISDKEGFANIIKDGKIHYLSVAKLAWCSLHNVNPFNVSDEYVFYFSGNPPKPIKKRVSNLSTTKNKSQMEFQKSLKAWAEKQGFYDTQKYITAMHDFIQKNGVSLKEANDFCVLKTASKDLEQLKTFFEKHHTIAITKDTYNKLESYAKIVDMTINEYIESCSKYLAISDKKTLEIAEEAFNHAQNSGEKISDYLLRLYIQDGQLNDIIDNLKSENNDLKIKIKSLQDDYNKYKILSNENIDSSSKDNDTLFEIKHELPKGWFITSIIVAYNTIADKKLLVCLENKENMAIIRKLDQTEDSQFNVDDLTSILMDAKQRLLVNNNYVENSSEELDLFECFYPKNTDHNDAVNNIDTSKMNIIDDN